MDKKIRIENVENSNIWYFGQPVKYIGTEDRPPMFGKIYKESNCFYALVRLENGSWSYFHPDNYEPIADVIDSCPASRNIQEDCDA